MSKVIKQMQVDSLKSTFKDVRDLVVLSIKGLSAQSDWFLRAALRKKKIHLQLVKNSYSRRVLDDLGIKIPAESPIWTGNTVFAWGGSSVSELSRSIEGELKAPKTAAQFKDKVTVKGAVADGQVVSFDMALKMPTRQEAIARVLALALSPASRLVSAFKGPAGNVAGQVKTISEKKEEAPAPSEKKEEAAAPPA